MMMKYIKLFETRGDSPEIDDYVILQIINAHLIPGKSAAFANFLSTNVGQIFNIFPADDNRTKYIVQYEYVPPEFQFNFSIRNYKDDTTEYFAKNVSRDNIAYYSKNKEDIQIYADAAKYNI